MRIVELKFEVNKLSSTNVFRPRTSTKYTPFGNSVSSNKNCSYSDPCVGGTTTFQQRLTELSMLEADTIRFEKNRKLKRKSKQEKET